MCRYIDNSKRLDFSKKKSIDDVIIDIRDKYKISNIRDDYDESLFCICEALYDDYEYKRANYESYIERGMNARLLMELRKSAVLNFGDSMDDFYTGHCRCKSAEDVKKFRKWYLHSLNEDYLDLDWQYFYLVKYTLQSRAIDFYLDYEPCFADGACRVPHNEEDYVKDFVNAHLIGYPGFHEL